MGAWSFSSAIVRAVTAALVSFEHLTCLLTLLAPTMSPVVLDCQSMQGLLFPVLREYWWFF
jgi:hypothetical protein